MSATPKNGVRLTLLVTFCVSLTGCKLVQLKKDTKTLQASTILVGTVSGELPSPGTPVIVAAYSRQGRTRTIVHHTSLHELAPYELMVPQGKYQVVAFADANRNWAYDAGEAAGQYAGADGVTAPVGGVVQQVDVVISRSPARAIDLPVGSAMPPKEVDISHSTAPGAIIDLNDVLFSDEYGRKGFWTPVEFFREVGGNVYFLEPYDPNRIPILFVHGVAGSPQNWQTVVENLDRTKFQAWFFYYPSGSSLNSMSHLLRWKLLNLQNRYRFPELYVTAHSMGGLVVRSLLVNFWEVLPPVTTFVSISTPWGGEARAEIGVKHSPVVMPVWRDMQPSGAFIASIYEQKMPPAVEHYLFFGHKGSPGLLRPNNDKVVTLASELDPRAQQEAKMVYGFNEDHVGVLSSAPVLSQFNAVIAAAYETTKKMVDVPGNRLCVDFSFEAPDEWPRPPMALLLHPTDEQQSETWLNLGPDASGHEYGPFPAGDYDVSLIAAGFAPEPVRAPVTIAAGQIPRIAFAMKPRGSLVGYVVTVDEGLRQAGTYVGPDEEVPIQSITLRGAGLTRTLIPSAEVEAEVDPAEPYLTGTDYVGQGVFYFCNLPAGSYDLTIEADGYEPYRTVRDVRPGRYEGELTIELTAATR